jgi:hypothetical protein
MATAATAEAHVAPRPGDHLHLDPADYRYHSPHGGPVDVRIQATLANRGYGDGRWWVVTARRTGAGGWYGPAELLQIRATALPDALTLRTT